MRKRASLLLGRPFLFLRHAEYSSASRGKKFRDSESSSE